MLKPKAFVEMKLQMGMEIRQGKREVWNSKWEIVHLKWKCCDQIKGE